MRKQLGFAFAALIFAVGLFTACGGGNNGGGTSPPPKPVISLTASAASIALGQSFTLTWSSGNCSGDLTASGDWSGTKPVSGSESITPATTGSKTYKLSCSGAGGSASASVNLAVFAALAVSPSAASAAAGETVSFTASGGNGAYSWSAPNGTPPSGAGTSFGVSYSAAGTYAVKVTSGDGQTANAAVAITAPQAPTLSMTPGAVNVAFGSSYDFALNRSGSPDPSVSCGVDGAGSVVVAGNTAVTYTLPNVQPASYLATINCVAANSAGSANGSATVNLIPKIASLPSDNIFCPRECVAVITAEVYGAFTGQTTFSSNVGNLLGLQPIDATHVKIYFNFDTPHYDPGFFEIWATEPSPGGGDSNHARLAFLGNLNTLALSDTETFQLDQADPNTLNGNNRPSGAVYKFKLADGSSDGKFPVGGLMYAISLDDRTRYVVITQNNGISWRDENGFQVGGQIGGTNSDMPLAVSAKDGYACASQDAAGNVVSAELLPGTQPLIPTAVGNAPWDVAMTRIGAQLACAVYNAGDGQFSLVKIPETVLWKSSTLNGLTLLGQLQNTGQGGWQLSVFDSGPAQGRAALLAQRDKTVVFVDSNTALETRRVALDGVPFRLVADNVHGAAIVALADIPVGLTRFVKVDAATGTVTQLAATVDFLATGLAVSADGLSLYVANRAQFRILPNN